MNEQNYRISLQRIEYGYVIIENVSSEEEALRKYIEGEFDEIYSEETWTAQDDWSTPTLDDVCLEFY